MDTRRMIYTGKEGNGEVRLEAVYKAGTSGAIIKDSDFTYKNKSIKSTGEIVAYVIRNIGMADLKLGDNIIKNNGCYVLAKRYLNMLKDSNVKLSNFGIKGEDSKFMYIVMTDGKNIHDIGINITINDENGKPIRIEDKYLSQMDKATKSAIAESILDRHIKVGTNSGRGCILELQRAYKIGTTGALVKIGGSLQSTGVIVAYVFKNVGDTDINYKGNIIGKDKHVVMSNGDIAGLNSSHIRLSNCVIKNANEKLDYVVPKDGTDIHNISTHISIDNAKGEPIGIQDKYLKQMSNITKESVLAYIKTNDKVARKVQILKTVKVVNSLKNAESAEIKGYIMRASFRVMFKQLNSNGMVDNISSDTGVPFIVTKEGLKDFIDNYGKDIDFGAFTLVGEGDKYYFRGNGKSIHDLDMVCNAATVINGEIVGIEPNFRRWISK